MTYEEALKFHTEIANGVPKNEYAGIVELAIQRCKEHLILNVYNQLTVHAMLFSIIIVNQDNGNEIDDFVLIAFIKGTSDFSFYVYEKLLNILKQYLMANLNPNFDKARTFF